LNIRHPSTIKKVVDTFPKKKRGSNRKVKKAFLILPMPFGEAEAGRLV
jgi:hypothetical protein